MSDIDLVIYILVFGLCVIFTSFTIERKSSMFSFITMVCWGMLAICHTGVASASNFIALAYLFVGFAFIFMVYGFALVFSAFEDRKRAQEWELR